MKPSIRAFTAGDIDHALVRASREKWTTSRAWLAGLWEHEPAGCFIAEIDRKQAGMVTSTCHRDTAWIGYLIVDPEHRGRGIGSALMEHVLHYLEKRGVRTIRLDADPPGISLYRRLGFTAEWESRRFRFHAGSVLRRSVATRLRAEDLDEVFLFDAPRFGDDRAAMIRILQRDAEASFCVRHGDDLSGYVLAHDTTTGLHIGPCAAVDRATAEILLHAALGCRGARPVTLGISDTNRSGCDLLKAIGFIETPPSIRMVYGAEQGRGNLREIFAIAHGAVG